MIYSALFAFLHFIFAFGIIVAIILERVLFAKNIDFNRAKNLRKADSLYGLSALMVLIIGFVRIFYFEKGSEFYFSSPFFHLKLTLFVLIGLMSIYPTVVFLKWRKRKELEFPIVMEDKVYNRIKRILNAEIGLVILLLLSASMMAKAIGL